MMVKPAVFLPPSSGDRTTTDDAPEQRLLNDEELRRLERENLVATLNHFRWKIAGSGGAAEFLGLHPATLASRLKSMGIERPRSSGG